MDWAQLSHYLKFVGKKKENNKIQPKKQKKKGSFRASPNCPADTNLPALNQLIPIYFNVNCI